jgi:hypothetical protein
MLLANLGSTRSMAPQPELFGIGRMHGPPSEGVDDGRVAARRADRPSLRV